MDPFCASIVALHCLVATPAAEPLGLSHNISGRFGVVYERDSTGRSQVSPANQLRYTITWRHQLDSGARVAFSVGLEGSNLRSDTLIP